MDLVMEKEGLGRERVSSVREVARIINRWGRKSL